MSEPRAVDLLVINDHVVSGVFGEPTLWNLLLDLGGVACDLRTERVGCVAELRAAARERYAPRLVIQNATFHPLFFPDRPTIALLQDNFRAMGGCSETQDPILDHATRVVVPSESVLTSYPERRAKARVIPIGVNTSWWSPAAAAADRRPTMLFVGDATAVKGYALAAEVARQLPDDWRFIWIFKRHAARPPRSGVVMTGVGRDEVRQAMRESTVMVVTSPVETQCVAACEALACDLPVVARPVGVFADWPRARPAEWNGVTVVDAHPSREVAEFVDSVIRSDRMGRAMPGEARAALLASDLTTERTRAAWREVIEEARACTA